MRKLFLLLSLNVITISSIYCASIPFKVVSDGHVTSYSIDKTKTIGALGYKSGKVVIFNLSTNNILSKYKSQTKKINSLVFNKNGELFSASDDGSLYKYKEQEEEKLFSIASKLSGIQIINDTIAYIASFKGQFYKYNFNEKKSSKLMNNANLLGIINFKYDIKRDEFIISTIRKKIFFLNRNLEVLKTKSIPNPDSKRIRSLKLSFSYNYLHIFYKDNSYALLDLNNLKEILSSPKKNFPILGAQLIDNDQTIAVSTNKTIQLIRIKDNKTLNIKVGNNANFISSINDSSLLLITQKGSSKIQNIKKEIVSSSTKNKDLSYYNFKNKNAQQIKLILKSYNPRIYFKNGKHLLHNLLEDPSISTDKFQIIFNILISKNIDFNKYDFAGVNVNSYDFKNTHKDHPYADVFNQFEQKKNELADTMFYSASLGKFDLVYDYIKLAGSRDLNRTNYLDKSIMEFAIEFNDKKTLKLLQNHPKVLNSQRTFLAVKLAIAGGNNFINNYYAETNKLHYKRFNNLLMAIKKSDLKNIKMNLMPTKFYEVTEIDLILAEINDLDENIAVEVLDILFTLGFNPFTYKINEPEKNEGFENDIFDLVYYSTPVLKFISSHDLLLGNTHHTLDKRKKTYLDLNPMGIFKDAFSNTKIPQKLIFSAIFYQDINAIKYLYETIYEKNNTIDENNILLQQLLQVALTNPNTVESIINYILYKMKSLSTKTNSELLNLSYMVLKDNINALSIAFRKWPKLLETKQSPELTLIALIYNPNETSSFIIKNFPISNQAHYLKEYIISNFLIATKKHVESLVKKHQLNLDIKVENNAWIFDSIMTKLLKNESKNQDKIKHLLKQSVFFNLSSDNSLKFKMLRKYKIKSDTQTKFFKSDGIVQRVIYMFDENQQDELLSMYNKKLPGRNILCKAQVVFPLYKSHTREFHDFYKNKLKCTQQIRNSKNETIELYRIRKGTSDGIDINTNLRDEIIGKTKMHYIIKYLDSASLEKTINSLDCENDNDYCQEILISILKRNKYKGAVRNFFRQNQDLSISNSRELESLIDKNKYFKKDADIRKLENLLDNFDLNNDSYDHYDFYPYFKKISNSKNFQDIYPTDLFDRLMMILFTKGKSYFNRNLNFINKRLKDEKKYIISERFFEVLRKSTIPSSLLGIIFEKNAKFNNPWAREQTYCNEYTPYSFLKKKNDISRLYEMVINNKNRDFSSLRINLCGNVGYIEIIKYVIQTYPESADSKIKEIYHSVFKYRDYETFSDRLYLLTKWKETGETFLKVLLDAKLYELAYEIFKEAIHLFDPYSKSDRKLHASISTIEIDSKKNTILHMLMNIDPDDLTDEEEDTIFNFAKLVSDFAGYNKLENEEGLTPYEVMIKNYGIFSKMRRMINE